MSHLTHWETARPVVQDHIRDMRQLARPTVSVEGHEYGQPVSRRFPPFKRLALVLLTVLRR